MNLRNGNSIIGMEIASIHRIGYHAWRAMVMKQYQMIGFGEKIALAYVAHILTHYLRAM
jgi:hypothetical protein